MKLLTKLLASCAFASTFAFACATLTFTPPLHAQDCSAIVNDSAEVIHDQAPIIQAAQPLINQGIDIRILTAHSATEPLSDIARRFARQCNLAVDSTVPVAKIIFKPNLLLLIVAPAAHKKNAFFGQAVAPALENAGTVDFLYSQSANPYFHTGDWAGGFAAAERDFAAKIAAYHDQAKHPTVKQTVITNNNQATDLHGFWIVLGWLLVIAAIFGLFILIVRLMHRRSAALSALTAAQGDAIEARNRATAAYSTTTERGLDSAFADLSNSVTNDPTVAGLSEDEYRRIQRAWNGFYYIAKPGAKMNGSGYSSGYSSGGKHRSRVSNKPTSPTHATHATHVSQASAPASTSASASTTPAPSAPSSTTVVNQSSSNDGLLTGLILGDMLGAHESRREEPRREEPRYEPDAAAAADAANSDSDSAADSDSDSDSAPSASFSSGDDSFWSSSSDSSSDSDSGSSSDFGSSDSGGGSDFSSGDDSSF